MRGRERDSDKREKERAGTERRERDRERGWTSEKETLTQYKYDEHDTGRDMDCLGHYLSRRTL
jgi:hypothetical protein